MVARLGRSRWIPAIAGFVAVVTTASLVVLWRDSRSDPRQIVRGGGEPGPNGVVATPGLAPRFYPAQAWTGERLFVFGGLDPDAGNWTLVNDGALVDPATGDAEILPASPFDPPLSSPKAVATGDHVVVIGHSCFVPPDSDPESSEPPCAPGVYAAAAYNQSEREWTTVAIPAELAGFTSAGPANAVVHALGATADGRAVFQLGDLFAPQFWTYAPARGTWTVIPDPGVQSQAACVDGGRLVVVTTNSGYVRPSLAVFDLARAERGWARSGPAEDTKLLSGPPRLACMGTHVMVVDPVNSAGGPSPVYNLDAATWSLPSPPPGHRFFAEEVWTGTELVFRPIEVEVGEPGFAYNPVTNTWRTLRGFPAVTRGAIWSGSALVGYSEPLATRPYMSVEEVRSTPPSEWPEPTFNPPGVFRYVPA